MADGDGRQCRGSWSGRAVDDADSAVLASAIMDVAQEHRGLGARLVEWTMNHPRPCLLCAAVAGVLNGTLLCLAWHGWSISALNALTR